MKLSLRLLPNRFAICRLPVNAEPPRWLEHGDLRSITWTQDETSVICDEGAVLEGVPSNPGWRCFMVQGPLDFNLTGVLSSLAEPLSKAGISIFAVSTFDTDYLLVRAEDVNRAKEILVQSGHSVLTAPGGP